MSQITPVLIGSIRRVGVDLAKTVIQKCMPWTALADGC
jgi:hypothetical protein